MDMTIIYFNQVDSFFKNIFMNKYGYKYNNVKLEIFIYLLKYSF
jgi:hypothetical protein